MVLGFKISQLMIVFITASLMPRCRSTACAPATVMSGLLSQINTLKQNSLPVYKQGTTAMVKMNITNLPSFVQLPSPEHSLKSSVDASLCGRPGMPIEVSLRGSNSALWHGLLAVSKYSYGTSTIQLLDANYSAAFGERTKCPNRNLQFCTHGTGPGDPRFISPETTGITYMLYNDNACLGDLGDQLNLRVFLRRVRPSLGPAIMLNTLLNQNGQSERMRRCEKNWAPFSIGQKLFVSYQLLPTHRVYELNETDGTSICVANSHTRTNAPEGMRGGTNAVAWRNAMIAVAHVTSYTKQGKFYRSIFYIFESKLPFNIVGVSLPFKLTQMQVEFPTTLSRTSQGFQIFYGCSDSTSHMISVTDDAVMALFHNNESSFFHKKAHKTHPLLSS
eukprot:CAMPEP_0119302174 /NCGR_PEP_ID=MMETSP1333-20130426/3829_1 /TAXON_ID=418940 /ORGANISM="Scyphosphaera apsteinii, Strain RCC1455" /LENGTH=389 /DNA_ID=CAMNT_0007304457 /DNA_START=124 /DNA_END=1293 /DNA_ORIENTATION=+